jgi:hypothetical protein
VASGINNATARVAGMLAVALLGAVAVGAFRARLDARLDALPISAEVRAALEREATKLAEAEVPPQVTGDDRQRLQLVLAESFVGSVRVVMLTASVLALLSGACAGLTIRPPGRA